MDFYSLGVLKNLGTVFSVFPSNTFTPCPLISEHSQLATCSALLVWGTHRCPMRGLSGFETKKTLNGASWTLNMMSPFA